MKTKPLKVAVVGCGYWGPNLIRVFSQLPYVSVTIACDLKTERLTRMKSIYPFIQTTQEFVDVVKSDVDAVIIATSFKTHFQLALDALNAKKHVLIEKPFVQKASQAQTLIALAKKQKKVLMIDNTFEYTAAVNYIKQMYRAGKLGDIYTIDMIRVNLGLFQNDINVVWDLAYHDLSIINYIFNMLPQDVICVGQGFIQKNIVDTAHLLLHYPNTMLVSIHVSWLEPKKIRQVTIVGSKKMLVYDDLESTDKIKTFDKGVTYKTMETIRPDFFETYDEFSYLYRSGDVHIPRLDQEEPLLTMAKHFINSLSKKKSPRSDGDSARRSIQILSAAQQSLQSGRWETINYD